MCTVKHLHRVNGMFVFRIGYFPEKSKRSVNPGQNNFQRGPISGRSVLVHKRRNQRNTTAQFKQVGMSISITENADFCTENRPGETHHGFYQCSFTGTVRAENKIMLSNRYLP